MRGVVQAREVTYKLKGAGPTRVGASARACARSGKGSQPPRRRRRARASQRLDLERGRHRHLARALGERSLETIDDSGWQVAGKPNTIANGIGYPLMSALMHRSLKCMKLLIKAGADVNGKGSIMTPLVFTTGSGGYTNFIRFLLNAGADPNIPDDLGRLPIERAAVRDCKEEVEMLFPYTNPIPNVPNWSIDGVISHAKIEAKKPLDKQDIERRKNMAKSSADKAFKQKDYMLALKMYDMVIDLGESATLYANRSICKLAMGDGEGALSDALRCRMLRPKWAKACYRQGAAHMLLKEYKQARDALLDAQKLDPGNAEVERELSKVMELMKTS